MGNVARRIGEWRGEVAGVEERSVLESEVDKRTRGKWQDGFAITFQTGGEHTSHKLELSVRHRRHLHEGRSHVHEEAGMTWIKVSGCVLRTHVRCTHEPNPRAVHPIADDRLQRNWC